MVATPLYPEQNINSVFTLKGLVSIAASDQLKMRRYQLATGKIKW